MADKRSQKSHEQCKPCEKHADHNKVLYCAECNVDVCVDCILEEHNGHKMAKCTHNIILYCNDCKVDICENCVLEHNGHSMTKCANPADIAEAAVSVIAQPERRKSIRAGKKVNLRQVKRKAGTSYSADEKSTKTVGLKQRRIVSSTEQVVMSPGLVEAQPTTSASPPKETNTPLPKIRPVKVNPNRASTSSRTKDNPHQATTNTSLSLEENFEVSRQCRDIAILEDGNILVCLDNKVVIYSKSGEIISNIGSSGPNKVKKPVGIAETPDGNVAVTDCGDNSIKVFTREGSYTYTITKGNETPHGIAILKNGTLAVCYPSDHCVNIYSSYRPPVRLISVIKSFHLTPRTLSRKKDTTENVIDILYPRHIAAHGETGVVVSDSRACAVFAFNLEGSSGNYTNEWMYDGKKGAKSGEGMLQGPYGVTACSQGHVLVADRGKNRVVSLSRNGESFKEILTGKDDICHPVAVSTRNEYVALSSNDCIKLYKYV